MDCISIEKNQGLLKNVYASMGQARLNHLMLLYIHSHLTDTVSHSIIFNGFIRGKEGRLSHFGKFSVCDLRPSLYA